MRVFIEHFAPLEHQKSRSARVLCHRRVPNSKGRPTVHRGRTRARTKAPPRLFLHYFQRGILLIVFRFVPRRLHLRAAKDSCRLKHLVVLNTIFIPIGVTNRFIPDQIRTPVPVVGWEPDGGSGSRSARHGRRLARPLRSQRVRLLQGLWNN